MTAAVTGGIDSNGMCPGDPSSYYERNGAYEMLPPGTINVFIYINQNVTEAAMVRSMMIASEAKAAAVFTSLYLEAVIQKKSRQVLVLTEW